MSVSSSWVQLHEKRTKPFFYYRRIEIYPRLPWGRPYQEFNVDLEKMKSAIAPFGGPIALVQEEERIVDKGVDEGGNSLSQTVHIYTSSGNKISELKWPKENSEIHTIGWLSDLKLVCLTKNGHVHLFDIHCRKIHGPWQDKIIIPDLNTLDRILKCIIWGEGIAVVTSSKLYVATDLFTNEKPFQVFACSELFFASYKNPNIEPSIAMEVVPSNLSISGNVEIYLAPDDQPRIFICTLSSCITMSTEDKSCIVYHIKLSPNGKYMALYTSKGEILVCGLDFKDTFVKFSVLEKVFVDEKDVNSQQQLEILSHQVSIAWCGDLCVLVTFTQLIEGDDTSLMLMIGCHGDYEKFCYEGPIRMCQECDCTRIITNYTCEILEKVHSSTVDIFRVGSLAPSALLYDAYMEYQNKKPSSIKTIMRIKDGEFDEEQEDGFRRDLNSLEVAALECIEAAVREFDPELQQQLLKAASFGRSFSNFKNDQDLEERTRDTFIQKCKELRVLNAVRSIQFGIPITYDQFKRLTARVLVDRLALMQYHYLAFKICDYLEISPGPVLVDWACTKARKKIKAEDRKAQIQACDELFNEIHNKLKDHDVSYAQIALTAYQSNNNILAKRLLNAETKHQDQIPLYLKMEETNLAISKAIASLDTDLLYLVILYMKKNFEPKYLYEVISKRKRARKLFISYCKEEDLKTLVDYYTFIESYRDAGMIKMIEAYNAPTDAMYMKHIKTSLKYLKKAPKYPIDGNLTNEHLNLLEIQKKLEQLLEKSGKKENFVGLSLNETFVKCLLVGLPTQAKKIRNMFCMPDRRYWLLNIKALGQLGDWKGLENFVFKENKGKSPVGFVPFVDTCLQYGKSEEAMKYIPKIDDVEIKVDYYIKLLKFKEAIEAAADVRDIELLEYIANKTTNAKTRDTIQNVIEQIEKEGK